MLQVEQHPLQPFLPPEAQILFLGSFPPPRNKWSMEFFYPNWINDHWRIQGELWFNDRNHFVDKTNKKFLVEDIKSFCHTKGIAYYDTAQAVLRHKNNASDAHLEVVTPTDICALLSQIPHCKAIVTTGEKATDTICRYFSIDTIPAVGESIPIPYQPCLPELILLRLPSSSRAYPLSFDKKVLAYQAIKTIIE